MDSRSGSLFRKIGDHFLRRGVEAHDVAQPHQAQLATHVVIAADEIQLTMAGHQLLLGADESAHTGTVDERDPAKIDDQPGVLLIEGLFYSALQMRKGTEINVAGNLQQGETLKLPDIDTNICIIQKRTSNELNAGHSAAH